MVTVREETQGEHLGPVFLDAVLSQKKRKVLLTTFTSSASLILSWPFPLIILCFQTNQRLIFDPRIYAALTIAYLLSGCLKRLLLKRFVSPSFFNAITPAILGLIGNGVFMTALYKSDSWNWVSVFFMFASRLIFGWSTYSAEDYNRRARNEAKSKREGEKIRERVGDMVPDLQDAAFHIGVLVALVICFILEVCLRYMGSQLAEFYSMLILSSFSVVLSFISVPSLHAAVNKLVKLRTHQDDDGHPEIGSQAQPNRSGGSTGGRPCPHAGNDSRNVEVRRRVISWSLTVRENYLISTIFSSFRRHHPPGQLAMTLFSALLTSATILFDYLLLPYSIIYLKRALFSLTLDYFPFPDLIFVYATLFISELVSRTLILKYSSFARRTIRLADSSLIGVLIAISSIFIFVPVVLYLVFMVDIGTANSVCGVYLFGLCVVEGLLKAAHSLFGGILFTKYCDELSIVPRSVAETGEQLLGVARCFFSTLVFTIGGIVLYYERFAATMVMVSVVQCLALSVAIFGFAEVFTCEKALRVRIELPD
ncbi:unnamed protein product [Mesocestoides corti]|nr:unnamed protein product [Mesocestoides corti]